MAWTSVPAITVNTAITQAWGQAVNNDIACCPAAIVTTQGDTFYATGLNALARLAIGTADKVYASTGTLPSWVDNVKMRQPACRATTSGNKTITAATWEPVSFDAASFQVGTLWAAGSPTRITIPQAGLYYVAASVWWNYVAGRDVGPRWAQLYVNGEADATLVNECTGVPGDAPVHGFSGIRAFAAGDYCELWVQYGEAAAITVGVPTTLGVCCIGRGS